MLHEFLVTYRSESTRRFTTGFTLHKHYVINSMTRLQGGTLTFIMQQEDAQTYRVVYIQGPV